MRLLIQRVRSARVLVDSGETGAIAQGLLVFLAVQPQDTELVADRLLEKLLAYRVFPDHQNKMNLGLRETDGGLLIVSQFTLAADTRKGLRPSFSSAAEPEQAERLYRYFVEAARARHSPVATGVFAADMQVELINDGPVTFLLES